MSLEILPAALRAAQPWRNGGGTTFEVARAAHPRRAGDFLWRVSIADVAQPGPFSPFPGHERLIAVVAGNGMQLLGLDAAPVLLRPFEVVRFAGAASVAAQLPHGPVKDFNVIFDAAACDTSLAFHDGPGEAPRDASVVLIVNHAGGECEWRRGPERGALARFDALRVEGASRESVSWEPGALIAVVRIDVRSVELP